MPRQRLSSPGVLNDDKEWRLGMKRKNPRRVVGGAAIASRLCQTVPQNLYELTWQLARQDPCTSSAPCKLEHDGARISQVIHIGHTLSFRVALPPQLITPSAPRPRDIAVLSVFHWCMYEVDATQAGPHELAQGLRFPQHSGSWLTRGQ